MSGYRVTDWDTTFEVDDKGGPWREGKFRRGALNYLRLPTTGTFARRIGMISRVALDRGSEVKGRLLDVLEFIAGMDRQGREGGIIRTVDGSAATDADIADMLGQPPESVTYALSVLSDKRVGILQIVDDNDNPRSEPESSGILPGSPGNSEESPGNPGPLSDQSPGISPIESAQGRAGQSRTEQDKAKAAAPEDPRADMPTARSCWNGVCDALHLAYGENNKAIGNFIRWLQARLFRDLIGKNVPGAVSLIEELIQKSATADGEPAAWFMGAVKKSLSEGGFGYRPTGRTRCFSGKNSGRVTT